MRTKRCLILLVVDPPDCDAQTGLVVCTSRTQPLGISNSKAEKKMTHSRLHSGAPIVAQVVQKSLNGTICIS
ncbi:MAG: hypothetical protein HC862_14130 [Scytonema sp. RU_4_4]|nr:hypothetical protein [Scytonema sp. RU_4_4]